MLFQRKRNIFFKETIDIKIMADKLNMNTFLLLSLCTLSWHVM